LLSFLSTLKRSLVTHKSAVLILLLGVFLPFQIFGDLAEDVWKQGGFPFDVPTLLAIHATAQPYLDAIAITLTKTGVFWGVFPATLLLMLVLFIQRRWRALSYVLITSVGCIAINRIVKVLLHRARPHLWVSPAPEFDYGFPSGHAMASMTFVVMIAILSWNSRWRWFVLIAGTLFVILIGWTRLYLGVHYPSDILAGWMAALSWAVGVSILIRPNREFERLNHGN
jgi:undecaprenyl-diphosphatase